MDLEERHQEHKHKMRETNENELPWKAWGSWFSWGSPIGLSLGYAITIVSTGVFLYLLHLAKLIA